MFGWCQPDIGSKSRREAAVILPCLPAFHAQVSLPLPAAALSTPPLAPLTCGFETHADPLGLAPSIPEDLYHLIKKAVSVRKHLERNRADKDAKL